MGMEYNNINEHEELLQMREQIAALRSKLESQAIVSENMILASINKGVSKIAPVLTEGAGVVTTRSHMHWFVTEYGAVDLYGKSLQERARLLISVAHPDHREALDKATFERYGSHHHYIKSKMNK